MPEPTLSVVVPCYNEQEGLAEFHRRMTAACRGLGVPYELVLVNDGSRDRTWEVIQELGRGDAAVVAVNLARNHGHQLAASAGLSVARGQRILLIDADLQDPPELLPAMMARLDDGVDVVYGQRRRRRQESFFKLATAFLFYRLIGALASVPIPPDTGDFRLMTRRVLDVLLAMPERHRFLRGMVSWVGHRQEPLLFDRDPRFAGQTHYPFKKMWRLAVDAVTGFSTRPLAWVGKAGALTLPVGVVLLGAGLVGGGGWASGLATTGWLSILASVQMLGLGILGEYVGRLSEQSKGRPLFLIESVRRPGLGAGVPAPPSQRHAA